MSAMRGRERGARRGVLRGEAGNVQYKHLPRFNRISVLGKLHMRWNDMEQRIVDFAL